MLVILVIPWLVRVWSNGWVVAMDKTQHDTHTNRHKHGIR